MLYIITWSDEDECYISEAKGYCLKCHGYTWRESLKELKKCIRFVDSKSFQRWLNK